MILLRNILAFIGLVTAITCQAQLEVFTFDMTELSVMNGSDYYMPMNKDSSVEVNIADRGSLVVIGEGKYKLAEFNGKSWKINSVGSLEISAGEESTFLVNLDKGSITVKSSGDTYMFFKNPKNNATFRKSYNDLLNYLKGIGMLKGSASSDPGATAPPASLNGVELNLAKMLGTPFGYTPVHEKKYTIDDLNSAAKRVWGWTLQLDRSRRTAGFLWPKLNGMKFQGFPIYQLEAYGYKGGIFTSDFYCQLIISDSAAEKHRAYKAVANYLRARGWTQTSAGEAHPTFYKGNVIVTCYIDKSTPFPGKIQYIINAQSFPNAEIVKKRISEGLG